MKDPKLSEIIKDINWIIILCCAYLIYTPIMIIYGNGEKTSLYGLIAGLIYLLFTINRKLKLLKTNMSDQFIKW